MNKQKIAIIADTGCDIPKEYYKREELFIVPFRVIYKDGEYIDGETISTEEVYARIKEEIPSTSLPSGKDILSILDRARDAGYEKAIIITVSSALSGTNNFMNLLASDYQGMQIKVLNTKNIGIGSGMFGIDALRCIDEGMTFEKLWERMQNQVNRSSVFFSLDTLEYLRKGGRIGHVASLIGMAIKIKPVISCDEDGVYYIVKKARGRKQSLQAIVESIREFLNGHKHYILAYCEAEAAEDMKKVKELLAEEAKNATLLLDDVTLSPCLGINTGPGLVGVGVYLLP